SHTRHLDSFPTRRSSDLGAGGRRGGNAVPGFRGVCLGAAGVAQAAAGTGHGNRAAGGARDSVMFRRVPPVHSPLSLAALSRGVAAALSNPAWRAARAEIDQWVRETFDPRAWAWTDSGTTALTLALRLATAERGSRRIALPAYGCYDLATACDGAGVEVLLYDLDPETLGPDWDSLGWALREGARAIVVAYLYGMPVDLVRVRALAATHQA